MTESRMQRKDIPIRRTARVGASILAVLLVALGGCGDEGLSSETVATPAQHVDPERCVACHAEEHRAWTGSHHDLAMQPATEETVLGDFDDAVFERYGVTTRFFREDGAYQVETEGPDGEPTVYEVRYVFGIDPLQQVLLDFGGGRLQVLSVCWDVQAKRWFHVYDEPIPHGDPLHWTGPFQNWNYMCAECHSTELRRGFDLATNTYDTTWKEIDVGCQACHGPGSEHVAWAERVGEGGVWSPDDPKGLVVDLGAADPQVQVDACARCHSRRNLVNGEYEHGRPLLDHYDPELLVAPLYHADGQILDEVYVYGSFVQSRMHRKGVRCTDCHDPHTTRLKQEGNAVCVRCHQTSPPEEFPSLAKRAYDGPAHHHHEPDTPGSSCVDCHMPATTYMQVDPRRDHSFRVPRPDLTEAVGVPNACNGCHETESAAWAVEQIRAWSDASGLGTPHFATTLAAARRGAAKALPRLLELAADGARPAIVRATALREMQRFGDRRVLDALRRAAEDPEGLVRAAAVDGVNGLIPRGAPPEGMRLKVEILAPRLSDPLRLVRTEAARGLASVPAVLLGAAARPAFDAALEEYLARQRSVEDRPDAWLNLGVLHEDLGDPKAAEAAYLTALRLDEDFIPVRFNLATLYNRLGRNDDAERRLREVVDRMPEQGEAWYSLGLLLAEMERYGDAAGSLSRAAALMPGRPRIHYNRALVLQQLGRNPEAEGALREAHRLDAGDVRVIQALALLAVGQRRWEVARTWATRLEALQPGDPSVRALREHIEQAARR
jgi:predicted CXXCH cytochrome family protein